MKRFYVVIARGGGRYEVWGRWHNIDAFTMHIADCSSKSDADHVCRALQEAEK